MSNKEKNEMLVGDGDEPFNFVQILIARRIPTGSERGLAQCGGQKVEASTM